MYEETEEAIKWLLNELVLAAPVATSKISTIVTDKDHSLRRCLKMIFPSAALLICKFHVHQIFRREIIVRKYGITREIKPKILSIFENMIHSKSEQSLENLSNELYQHGLPELNSYFDKNWKPIFNEWVIGVSKAENFYNNTTNNRLESLNQKLKSVVKKFSTLEEFFINYFKFLTSNRIERKNLIVRELFKTCDVDITSDIHRSYFCYLTPYAYSKMLKELNNVKNTEDTNGATIETCTCLHRRSFHLPCRHILKQRALNIVNVFNESICHSRWTRQHAHDFIRLRGSEYQNSSSNGDIIRYKKNDSLGTFSARLKLAAAYSTKLAAVSAEFCGDFYDMCLEAMQALEVCIRNHDMEKIKKAVQISCLLLFHKIINNLVKRDHNRDRKPGRLTFTDSECEASMSGI